MIEAAVQLGIAQKFSLPPPLVAVLAERKVPESLIAQYDLDPKVVKDPAAALTIVAHAVAQSISNHHSLEEALSHVYAGDPKAASYGTSPAGGMVTGILADTALKATEGWNGYQPADPHAFNRVAMEFGNFLHDTHEAGGIVGEGLLDFWKQASARFAPPSKTPPPMGAPASAGRVASAPQPRGSSPADVEDFASQMKGLNIDVDHFLRHFQTYSGMRRKMLKSKTSLDDYATVAQMNPAEMLSHIRQQPHPTYPHLTAGQYADAEGMATAHSIPSQQRLPHPAEVASLASSGAKWHDVNAFYANQGPRRG